MRWFLLLWSLVSIVPETGIANNSKTSTQQAELEKVSKQYDKLIRICMKSPMCRTAKRNQDDFRELKQIDYTLIQLENKLKKLMSKSRH